MNKDQVISEALQQIGIPCHLMGFCFAKEAVSMVLDSPELIYQMVGVLYPTIAEKYKSSGSRVERAIRHAIDIAWSNRKLKIIAGVLGPNATWERMTNAEFIATLAERLRHQLAEAS